MKLLFSIAASSVISGSLLAADQAKARPFIYVNSWAYNGSALQCIENVEPVLSKLKFENFDSQQTDDKRATKITGYHKKEYVTVEIECDQKLGITVIGVAGIDNDLTYEIYSKLRKAQW